jgi:diguanylate cyclase (GGDEF)-like protein
MTFSFFRPRLATIGPNPVLPESGQEKERVAALRALHSILGALPQSNSGRENIRLLCEEILGASNHLRLIWVGFSEGIADRVKPYAATGEAFAECGDWRLPSGCFNSAGSYSQVAPTGAADEQAASLFAPWKSNPQSCTARCALALPLRSENHGLQGMIVFYADSLDYFSRIGLDSFQAFCNVAEIIWKQSNLMHLLAQTAREDPLTGLLNRRHIMLCLEKEMEAADKAGSPLCILVGRIEGFSKLNALYGAQAADAILAAFSKEAVEQLRPQDRCGRWTGTEFLYVLPNTDPAQAEHLAGKLREYFQFNPVSVKSWSVRVSLAVGIASYSKFIIGVDDLILQANQSMLSDTDELPTTILQDREPLGWR